MHRIRRRRGEALDLSLGVKGPLTQCTTPSMGWLPEFAVANMRTYMPRASHAGFPILGKQSPDTKAIGPSLFQHGQYPVLLYLGGVSMKAFTGPKLSEPLCTFNTTEAAWRMRGSAAHIHGSSLTRAPWRPRDPDRRPGGTHRTNLEVLIVPRLRALEEGIPGFWLLGRVRTPGHIGVSSSGPWVLL